MTTYLMGADIGQTNDYTALIILEQDNRVITVGDGRRAQTKTEKHYSLVHAERFRDIPYPAQIQRIKERFNELKGIAPLGQQNDVRLIVDATGVGKPILDALKDAGLQPRGVMITGGETESRDGSIIRVPKRVLVSHLQVVLQSERLKIAAELPLAGLLLKEFAGFKVKVTLHGAQFGNDVGAWREADHDDLVLSTALAVWSGESQAVRRPPVRSYSTTIL